MQLMAWQEITRCVVAGLRAGMAPSVHSSFPVLWAGMGFPDFGVLVAVPAWRSCCNSVDPEIFRTCNLLFLLKSTLGFLHNL